MNDTKLQDAAVYECGEKIVEQISYALLRDYIHRFLVNPLWIDANRLVCNQIKSEL